MPPRTVTPAPATNGHAMSATAVPVSITKKAPPAAHEWISFPDVEEERTWVFDVTFLLSPWTCIFGRGCQGVLTGPTPEMVQGCCSYGAHFTDKDDVKRVLKAAATLTDADWQFRKKGYKDGKLHIIKVDKAGDTVTRLVRDACIFLNRPGFSGGAGCALHAAAMRRGESYVALKPNVCWQLPLRREDEVDDHGHVTSTVRQWDRKHWGDGGFEFHWWCTEGPDAFVGTTLVYQSMREELVEMTSEKVYRTLKKYLDARVQQPAAVIPHPAIRRR